MPRLLFVTKRPFYPDSSGGGQHSALYLFKQLRQLGWQVEIICARSRHSPYFWRSCWQSVLRFQLPFAVVKDCDFGYPCWRRISEYTNEQQWFEFLDQRLQAYRPDVVLGHCYPTCPLLNQAVDQGYQGFYFARSADHFEAGASVSKGIHVLANSPFTASVAMQVTNEDVGIVLPFVERERYRVREHQRRYITFINPIPEKGVHVATEIARRLPQERFLFVKGKWVTYSGQEDDFLRTAYTLPNVKVWEHQQDTRKIYAVTDILLVPSQYTETFGRVIVEAQVNGIPVVAANTGGIPYTLGRGGLLIEPKDDPLAYVNALQQLRTDERFYRELSALALQNSQRLEFSPHYQVQKFTQFVASRI